MNLPNLNLTLTLAQEFHLNQIKESANNQSKEDLQKMIVQLVKMDMIKSNVIKQLMKS